MSVGLFAGARGGGTALSGLPAVIWKQFAGLAPRAASAKA
jgi:hypothetical protein